MSWLIFALLAALFFSIGYILDKILLDKHFKHPLTLLVFKTIIWLSIWLVLPFTGFSIPSKELLFFIIVISLIDTLAFLPFLKAMSLEEASRIAPLHELRAVVAFVLAFLFLGERLSSNQLIAFVLILIGGFIISVKDVKGIFKIRRAFWLMCLVIVMRGTNIILLKYLFTNAEYWSAIALLMLFDFFIAICFLVIKSIRSEFLRTFRSGKSIWLLIIANGLMYIGGILANNYALKSGPASIISVIGGVRTLFVFLIAILISRYLPKVLKEELSWNVLLVKIIAIGMIFVGLYYLYI